MAGTLNLKCWIIEKFEYNGVNFNFIEGYPNCQKYVPIDLANPSKVIASEAQHSLRVCKRLYRRKAPRNDGLSEYISDNRYQLGDIYFSLLLYIDI
jgi:hypothetical protein